MQNEPDFGLVGNVALNAGLGEYQQRQQQLAQQAAERQQAIQARMQEAAARDATVQEGYKNRSDIEAQKQQGKAEYRDWRGGIYDEQNDIKRQQLAQQAGIAQANMETRRQMQQEQFEQQRDMMVAKQANASAQEFQKHFDNKYGSLEEKVDPSTLTPAGQEKFTKWKAEKDAMSAAFPSMPPEQRYNGFRQFYDKWKGFDPRLFKKPPDTLQARTEMDGNTPVYRDAKGNFVATPGGKQQAEQAQKANDAYTRHLDIVAKNNPTMKPDEQSALARKNAYEAENFGRVMAGLQPLPPLPPPTTTVGQINAAHAAGMAGNLNPNAEQEQEGNAKVKAAAESSGDQRPDGDGYVINSRGNRVKADQQQAPQKQIPGPDGKPMGIVVAKHPESGAMVPMAQATPEQAGLLPPGTVYIGLDGQMRRKK